MFLYLCLVGAVWGGTTSGATTYALGRAACVYFGKVKDDGHVDVTAIRRVYADAFKRAAMFLERRERTGPPALGSEEISDRRRIGRTAEPAEGGE